MIVLDPTNDPIEVQSKLAPRLESVKGAVLGVVDNGKKNSETLLQAVVEAIQGKHDIAQVVWIHKTNPSLPMPASMLEQLKSCNAVIAGIGD